MSASGDSAEPSLWRIGFARFRADLFWAGLLALIAIAAAWHQMPFALYRLDNLSFYLPWYEHLGSALRSFDLPGWLPSTMSGSPFASDPQSGWGYLPAMVTMAMFPTIAGYKLFITAHVLMAALGTYLYIRNLDMRPVAAFTGGAIFAFGNFLERANCCTIHMQVLVWIPLIFLCIDRIFKTTNPYHRWLWAIAGGACVGQMVAGWIGQGAYYGVLAVVIYLIYRTLNVWNRDRQLPWYRLIGAGAVAAVVTGCVAATAYLPRLEMITRSNLADLYDDGTGTPRAFGWPLITMIERILGQMTREGRWYLGMGGLALVVIGPFLVRRKDALFFAIYTLFVLSMILRDSPTVWLFNFLPRFESLHAHSPDRIYVILFIGPAVVGAAIVDALADRTWKPPRLAIQIIAVSLPTLLLVGATYWLKDAENSWLPLNRFGLVAILSLGVLLGMQRRHPRTVKIGILVVLMVILYDPMIRLAIFRSADPDRRSSAEQLVWNNVNPTTTSDWLVARMEDDGVFRFYGYDMEAMTLPTGERSTYAIGNYKPYTYALMVNNRGMHFNLQDIQGYNPVQLQDYVDYINALNGKEQSYHMASVLEGGLTSPLLNLLNVRYIIIPAELPPDRPDLALMSSRYPTVFTDGTVRVLENTQAMPRAWLVHDVQQVPAEAMLREFQLGHVDPAQTALIDTEPPILEAANPSVADSVEITSYEDDTIKLKVTTGSRGMVVLSEIWDPGWVAEVDGHEVDILQVNGVLRGIVVDGGEHTVVLRFPATLERATFALWLVPFALIPILLGGEYLWRKRRGEQSSDDETAYWPLLPEAIGDDPFDVDPPPPSPEAGHDARSAPV